ncbi:MAG: hypothetical protein HY393_00700, partial [Candidatus Diapherotrites archaeon]|nr:hypothetical protein [Candidatus Diapherotrites archaeon]
ALALLGQGPVTFDSAIQSQDVVLYQNKVSNSAALKWAYTRGNGTEIYLTSTNYADSAGAAGGDGEAGLKLLAPLPGSIVGPKAVGSETVPFVFELSGTSGVQGPLYVNVELVAPGSSGEKTVLFDAVSLDALDSAPTPFLSCVNSEAMLVSTCTFKKEVGAIPTGPYLVSASLVNEGGAVLASDATPYAVTFDFEAPQLMVQAPVQETANTSKLVVFTVKDNVGVALEDVYFFVNGDHVGFEEGACSQPDPNLWLCGQQANAIQPGANLFGLQALDVAGNQGTLEPFAFSYSETPLADQNCPVFELSDQNTTIVTLPFPFKTVFEVPGTALYFFGSGIEKGVEVASSAVESLGAFKYVLLLLAGIASGLLCFQLLGRFFEGVKTTRRERMETMKRGILSLALALLVLYVGLNVRVFNGIAVAVLEVVLVLVGVFVVQRIQRMHAFKPVRVEKPR